MPRARSLNLSNNCIRDDGGEELAGVLASVPSTDSCQSLARRSCHHVCDSEIRYPIYIDGDGFVLNKGALADNDGQHVRPLEDEGPVEET